MSATEIDGTSPTPGTVTDKRDNPEERYRIAHLSDLHFGRGWSEENWHYVCDLLREFRPHLLVVTGDIVDSPTLFMLAMVRNALDALVNDTKCEFHIVPGNHDVGVWGNVYRWPWRGKFGLVYSRHYRVFDKVGSWETHFRAKRWRRIGRWIWWTSRFALQRLSLSLRETDEYTLLNPLVHTTEKGGVVLAKFDSNYGAKLATGRVSADALMSLEAKIHRLGRGRECQKAFFGPRIALLHHHALAIPYSTAFESLTSFEPFLALRNSGDLLHVLGTLEFDLVLHGHKHYWNFARVSFDAPGGDASELAIVAAGSATLRKPESRWNAFNLFELLPNGMITHRQHRFALGVPAKATEALSKSGERWLSSAQSVKERMYRKAVRLLQSSCDLIERSVKLDAEGAAQFKFEVRGLRVLGTQTLDRFRFAFGVENGAISPASAELEARTAAHGHRLEVNRRERPSKRLELPILLAAELHRDQPLDLGATCRTINTFAISEWEARLLPGMGNNDWRLLPGMGNNDWVSATVRHPADRLRLKVQLPGEFVNPNPKVRVMRPAGYPTLELDSKCCEVKLPKDYKQWIEDVEMTQLESENLIERGANCFELNVNKPLVGYCYLIRWEVKTAETVPPPLSLGVARQLRETLLKMIDDSATDGLKKVRALGQKMFDEAFEKILFPTFESAYHSEESLVAALFVLDESKSPPVLQLVLESAKGPAIGACSTGSNRASTERGTSRIIPINEGVAGTAFKKRHPSVYASSELVNADSRGAYVYYPPGELPPENERFSVLAAVPIYLSDDGSQRDVTPEEMIGVFTLGTNAKDSGLLRLIETSNGETKTRGIEEKAIENSAGQFFNLFNSIDFFKTHFRRLFWNETKGSDIYMIWTFALQFMRGLATAISKGARGIESPES